MTRPAWTPDRKAQLAALLDEGKSYSEVATLLGVTKNAVTGQARTLGIGTAKRGPAPTKRTLGSPSEGVASRFGGCRFIEGDPRRAKEGVDIWCGEKVAGPGEPYCQAHRERCWAGKPVPAAKAPPVGVILDRGLARVFG